MRLRVPLATGAAMLCGSAMLTCTPRESSADAAGSTEPVGAVSQLGADIDGATPGQELGENVAASADGGRLAISGLAGPVQVFDWDGVAWVRVGAGVGAETGECTGCSVSLSADGDRLAVGAATAGTRAGVVRLFDWDGSGWTQAGSELHGERGDSFGSSVSLSADGKRVAVGTDDEDHRGYVRVHDWDGVDWARAGADIDGEIDTGEFALRTASMSADGRRVAIGAPGNAMDAGLVQVYQWTDGAWVQAGADIDGKADSKLGRSVALSADGNRVAVGASHSGNLAGHVGVYDWNGTTWIQAGADIVGGEGDQAGSSVSLSAVGTRVAVGAPFADGNGESSGQVGIWDWIGDAWVRSAGIGGAAAFDMSGASVSLSAGGDRIAVGAPGNDGNGDWSGHVRVYSLLASDLPAPTTTPAAAPTTAEPTATLPETGSTSDTPLLLASVLFGGGLVLGVAARRRTPSSPATSPLSGDRRELSRRITDGTNDQPPRVTS